MYRTFKWVAAVSVALLVAGSLEAAPKTLNKVAALTGRNCLVRALSLYVVNTPAEWREMSEACFNRTAGWSQVMRFDKDGAELPAERVDFNVSRAMEPPASLDDHTALCVFTGKMPSGAPWLEVTSVIEHGDMVVVDFKITTPENVARAVKDPSCFTIVFVPKLARHSLGDGATTKPVVFRTAGRTVIATVGGVSGGNVVEGLQIALEPATTAWHPGDPIEFGLKATNVSDKPVRVPAWGMDAEQILEFTDAKGSVLANPGFGRKATRQIAPENISTIAPGASFRFALQGFMHERDGKRWLQIGELRGGAYSWTLAEGDYSLRAVLDLKTNDELNQLAGGECWTGRVTSSPVKVAYHAENLAWGETANCIAIALDTRPAPWTPGIIEFGCTVKNTTERYLRLPSWGLDLGQTLEIVDAKGNVLRGDGGRNGTARMPANAVVVIPPKELWRFSLRGQLYDNKGLTVWELLGGVWHWNLADGDYTVRAVLSRDADSLKPRDDAGGTGESWIGKAVSAPVKVAVAPRPATANADLTPLAPVPGRVARGLKLTLTAERTLLEMTARELLRATADTPRWNVAPVKLRLTFTNDGDKPVKLDAYDLEFSRMRLDAFGPDNKSVQIDGPVAANAGEKYVDYIWKDADAPDHNPAPPAEADYPTLNPGKSWTCVWRLNFPGWFGERKYTLLKPGDYNVKVTYSVPELTAGAKATALEEGVWRGSVTSNFVELTAGPAGEAVDGLKLTISADKTDLRMTPLNLRRATEEQPHFAIEPARISVTFTNVSKKPITVDAFNFVRSRIRIHAEGPDRGLFITPRPIDTTVERMMRGPVPSDYHTLEPGKSWTFENAIAFPGDIGANTYVLNAAGNYKLHVSYTAPEAPDRFVRERPDDTWAGTLVSNEIVFRGMEDDVKAAPARVELADAPDKGPKSGEAVNGLTLTLSADKTELKMTPRNLRRADANTPGFNVEPAKLTFTFTNTSDKPIKLDAFDLVWRHLRIDATGPDVESVRVLKQIIYRKVTEPAAADFPVIEPGKSWSPQFPENFPGLFADREFILLKPGEYRVKATYSVSGAPGANEESPLERGIWRGTVPSNEIVLTAVEENVQAPAKVELADAPKSGEAVKGLALAISADGNELKMMPRAYFRAAVNSPRYAIPPVKLTFTFTNAGDKPVKVDLYDLVWSKVRLEVTGPDAESVLVRPVDVDRKMAPPAEKDYPTIAPGKSLTFGWQPSFPGMFGDKEYILQKTGEYRVKAVYDVAELQVGSNPATALTSGIWRGSVTSNEIVLKGVEVTAPPAGAGIGMKVDAVAGAGDATAMPGKVVNGLQLAISSETHASAMCPRQIRFSTEKTPRQDAGPVTFTLTFMNRSDKPIKLDAQALEYRLVTFDIAGPNAKSVVKGPLQADVQLEEATEKDFPMIEPGKSWSWKVTAKFPADFGGSYFALQEPGNYIFKATYLKPEPKGADGKLAEPLWTGSVTSNAAVVYFAEPPVTQAAPSVPKGLELTISADRTELKMTRINHARSAPDAPPFEVEPVKLTVTFTNRTDKPLKLDAYDITGAHLTFSVTGPDADSLRVERRMVNFMLAAPTEKDYPTIEPGKSWTMDWQPTFPGMFGRTVYTPLKPGDFRLRMVYSRQAPPMDGDIMTFADNAWAGTVTSNELALKGVVVEEKPAGPAHVELAAAPAPKSGEAASGLKLAISVDKTELKMTRRNYARSSPDSPPYNIEPATLSFTFINVSDKPIKVDVYDLVWSRLSLDAEGPEAGSVRITKYKPFVEREMIASTEKDFPTIAPGKSFTCAATVKFPGDVGGLDYTLLKPGDYRVKITYRVPLPVPSTAVLRKPAFEEGAWCGVIVSNEIVLKGVVVAAAPPGPAKVELADAPAKPASAIKLTVSVDRTDLKMTPRSYRRSAPDSAPWWVEAATLKFTFTNTSDKPIKLDLYDLEWRQLRISVTGPDADSVRAVDQRKYMTRARIAPTEQDFPTIAPGKSFTCAATSKFPGYFGGTNYDLLKPGEYRLRITYETDVPDEGEDARVLSEGTWTGTATSNEITLKCAVAEGAAPRPETPERAEASPYKLGDAVRGLKLTLSAEKNEFKMTPRNLRRATRDTPRWDVEPVNLIFTFTNVSDKPLKVNVYDLVETKMHLTVTGPNGDAVRQEVVGGVGAAMAHVPAGPAFFPVIEPGKTYTCDVKAAFPGDFAFIRYTLMGPGEYKLQALYDSGVKMFPGDTPLERDVWLGRVASNEIVLKGVGVGELTPIADAVPPGEAVNGLKLSLAADKTELQMTEVKLRGLVADASRYLTETVHLTLTFTNVSDKPITLDAYDLPWRRLDLDAVGPEANSVWRGPMRAMRTLAAPAAKDYPTIESGKSWSCPVTIPGVYGQWEYSLRQPGEYKVKVLYAVAEGRGADGKPAFGANAWTGIVSSNEIMLKCVAAEEKAAAPAGARSIPTEFPLDAAAVDKIVFDLAKARKIAPDHVYKPVEPKVSALVSDSDATGGRVEIANPMVNTVFRQVLLGYGMAAPARVYAAVDREGKVTCPFDVEDDFDKLLAREDRSKWTDAMYADSAKLYIHLLSVANVDGWRVLEKPADFMAITFNMRKDNAGVKMRQAAADQIAPVAVVRGRDKVTVTLFAWHNIGGKLMRWTVELGAKSAAHSEEMGRFGGGGYD